MPSRGLTRQPQPQRRSPLTRDPTDAAAELHERAVALREGAELSKARRVCCRSLSLFEAHSGPRHPDVANVLIELARIESDRGDHDAALAQLQRALRILALYRRPVEVLQMRAIALEQLGALRVARGEYRLAEAPCKRAIDLARRVLSASEVASTMNGLAVSYKYTGRFTEARALYKKALAMIVRAHGDGHPAVATVLHNLGGLEHSRGRFARAEPFARRSVEVREAALGGDHVDVAADVAALAAIVHGRGRLDEAEALYRRALAVFTRALGASHFEVGFNLGQLAALCYADGRFGESSRLYARALRIQTKALGAKHPVVALTTANFAALRREQGRHGEARALYRKALATYKATVGLRHPDAIACADALAAIRNVGDLK